MRMLHCGFALALTLCVSNVSAQSPTMDDVDESATASITERSTIKAIDPKTRLVTLLPNNGGKTFTVKADGVRNFNKLKVGQTVAATYYQSVAVGLQPAGSAEAGAYVEDEAARAEPGQLPGGIKAQVVTVFAPIVAISTDKNTVAIQEPDGNHRIVSVRKPEYQALLPSLKKGDLVRLTFTEAVAIGIE